MVAKCRAVLPRNRKKQGMGVGGPTDADDSQGGKARDAQIIRGRLERETLSHMGPEIPVPQVPGTHSGGGSESEVGPHLQGGEPLKAGWLGLTRREAGGTTV